MPTKNPLRLEEIEPEMLSDDPSLVYVHELAYSNGAVYRGQIKSVEQVQKERERLSQSQSRNSNVSISDQKMLRNSSNNISLV